MVDPFYLKKNIDVQGDVGQEREQVERCHFVRQTIRSILGVLLLILLMSSASASELPGDSTEGKRLYDANCMGCHDTGVHTRKDRIVQSLDALKKRLGDCSHMAGKEFSATETQNLIKYLNDQFYQFR
jgi:cytochrome c553